MPDLITFAVVIGFGLVILAGRLLGAGTELAIEGLFPPKGQVDWPRGVQQEDLPRFVFGRAG
jgi:hypothetical protein